MPVILHVHASCHNVGDYLLVDQLHDALRAELGPGLEFISVTPRIEGAFDRSRWIDQRRVLEGRLDSESLQILGRADLALIGGGDLLTGRSSFRLYRSLTAASLPLYLMGIGVNLRNIRPRLRRPLLRELERARLLVTRDEGSHDHLAAAGLDNLRSGVDASALLFDDERYRHGGQRAVPAPPLLAVSLRAPEGNTASWGEPEYLAIAAALDRLVEEDGARIEFVSMTGPGGAPGNDDMPVLERVRSAMTSAGADRCPVSSVPQKPQEALAYLSRFDALAGMRLHALALATLAGVAVVAFAYSPKIQGWWNQLIPPESRDRFGSRAPLPPDQWKRPEDIVLSIRRALQRDDEEVETIARSLGAQSRIARSHVAECATLMKADLARSRTRPGSPGPRVPVRYRFQTRWVEPLRDLGERVWGRL